MNAPLEKSLLETIKAPHFPSMTDTRMVSGRTAAAICSTVTRPLSWGCR